MCLPKIGRGQVYRTYSYKYPKALPKIGWTHAARRIVANIAKLPELVQKS
jgi:hypothetical protein